MKSLLKTISCLFFLFGGFPAFNAYAQHQEVTEKPDMWKGKETLPKDTTSILHAFKSGHVEGHFRYYFSATNNNRGLTDYFANAVGGGLRYETASFHGFQMGISGFYIFNVGSSDMAQPDSATGQFNRYEIGLFDVEDPSNKQDIDRLEELYIKYNYRKSFIRYGRQLINTPFINLQDGRMRPTGVGGIWFEMNEVKKMHVEGGWLYAISPRSTVRWYDTGHSVGIYPMGLTTTGETSDYRGNISSKGVFSLGMKYEATPWLSISMWELMFENVQNTALLQADAKIKMKGPTALIAGGQFIRQDALNHGGNADPQKTYVNKGAAAMTLGGRIGIKHKQLEATANYTRILGTGRYLMPREWGRDPFYTFMPRERNEGFGDVHAVVAKLAYDLPRQRIKTAVSAGYFKLPDVKNVELNKYGMFKGLEAQLLVVAKGNQGEIYGNKRYEFNKVNMMVSNLVLNYHF